MVVMKVFGILLFLCGSSFAAVPSDSKIVGGYAVFIQEVPYQVSLRLRNLHHGDPFHICGAAIISAYNILTAAHCTKDSNPTLMSVRVGSSSSIAGGETFQVAKKVEHPNYDAATFDCDVSVLTLVQPMTFNNNIQPISLPNSGMKIPAGEPTTVSGWGFIEENIGKVENQLRAVSVPIIDSVKCQQLYQYVGNGYPSSITPNMICAGYEEGEKDACQGDSGGPLNYYNPITKREELVGIVSWGVGCAAKGYPGVYTNVAVLNPWITQNMKQ